MVVQPKEKTGRAKAYNWGLSKNLDVPSDPLQIRLDFHNEVVVMTTFEKTTGSTKVVSAMDVAHALARELSYGTGLLPANTLWWSNTKEGPVFALWEGPRVRKLALQEHANQPPKRFTIPLPGLVFLCMPGKVPWVYAMKKRPTKLTDIVYRAPFCNVFENGRICQGSHKFPKAPAEVPESFLRSFFSPTADLRNRSAQFVENIVHLWEFLEGKKTYPLDDLVKHGRLKDLEQMDMKGI